MQPAYGLSNTHTSALPPELDREGIPKGQRGIPGPGPHTLLVVFESAQICYMVPYKDGREAEAYWRWVQEAEPPLPRGFRDKFHMAAIYLQVYRAPLATCPYFSRLTL